MLGKVIEHQKKVVVHNKRLVAFGKIRGRFGVLGIWWLVGAEVSVPGVERCQLIAC